MINCEPPLRNAQSDQLPAELETEIVDWVDKERGAGFIITRQLLYWFASKLAQRDDSVGHLAPDFLDSFLSRHTEVAEKLVPPPHPLAHHARVAAAAPTGAFARMKERMAQDRRKAMFGDSPPPEREPAPYPEGDIIHNLFHRYLVRHGNTLTKYTTHPDGMGRHDTPNEALALSYIKEHTTIPVPQVISSSWDRVTMEYIEGQTLQQAWPVLTPTERSGILGQLRGYIKQLRALSGMYVGRLNGEGALVPSIITRSGGPFQTVSEFQEWLATPRLRPAKQSIYWHQITTQLGADYPIVFTHSDITPRNILVRDGQIVAIVDGEMAGWYPEYWEYVWALHGMDHIDWENLGCLVPSLFDKRHDLEYILVQFVANIS